MSTLPPSAPQSNEAVERDDAGPVMSQNITEGNTADGAPEAQAAQGSNASELDMSVADLARFAREMREESAARNAARMARVEQMEARLQVLVRSWAAMTKELDLLKEVVCDLVCDSANGSLSGLCTIAM